jgi:hypothetical protein
MRFMLDNNLSPRLARALNALTENDGDSVDHLRSRGLDAEPDEVYISELAKEGSWVVVTCDTSMARKPHEVKAWIDSGLVFVMLKHGWIALDFWKKAWKLIRIWPEIRAKAKRARPGTGISVPVTSSIKFLNPPHESP